MCEKNVYYCAESLYESYTRMELCGSFNFKGGIRNPLVVFAFRSRKRKNRRRVGSRRFVSARDPGESRLPYGEEHKKSALRSE